MSAPRSASPAELAALKPVVRALYQRLAAVAESIGLTSAAADIRSSRARKLEQDEVSLVVLGEFNHGKSTFINALLEAPVLPVGVIPTTATLIELRHGEQPSAEAVRADGRREALAADQLRAVLTIGDARPVSAQPAAAPPVDRVELRQPASVLRDGLVIIDTPGVNDMSEQRADITFGVIPHADAVVFLLDATQVLTASERRFLEERVLRTARDRIVFVVAKADLLEAGELDEALAFARRHLEPIVPAPPLFAVSAKRWAAGRRDESGMSPLLAHLRGMLGVNFADAPPAAGGDEEPHAHRRRLVLDHALIDASRLAAFIRQSAGIRVASAALPIAELEARVLRAQERLRDGNQVLADAVATIAAETAGLKARVRQDLEGFVARWQESLARDIESATPEDLQKYLDAYLEDTWKGWVEHEGDIIASTLDRLAERIVEVTNEKLSTIAAALSEGLEPLASVVELPTSALPAEASVFALGVVGSTALLFVSGLMGGVLALVTPLVAGLVRSRAAREAKAEAKTRAPAAVAQVAAALPPRLDEVIDGFGARLETFVAEAGAALARGMAELLERALAEKRRLASDTPGVPDETAAALVELRAIDELLAETRQRLWT